MSLDLALLVVFTLVGLLAVVVLTGSTDPSYETRARALGATDDYRTPTDLMGLGDTVKEIVTRWIDPRDIMAAHMRFCG